MHLNLEVNRITTCNNTMIPDIEKHVTHQVWRKNENCHDCSREVSRDIQIFFANKQLLLKPPENVKCRQTLHQQHTQGHRL